jgi:hypothetical protein
MFELILEAIENGNIEILERLMTRVEVNENKREYEEKIEIGTKISKNRDPPLYLYTATNISELFMCAAKRNRVNILKWFNCKVFFDLPFWKEEEKEQCIKTFVLNFYSSLSIRILELLNTLL